MHQSTLCSGRVSRKPVCMTHCEDSSFNRTLPDIHLLDQTKMQDHLSRKTVRKLQKKLI